MKERDKEERVGVGHDDDVGLITIPLAIPGASFETTDLECHTAPVKKQTCHV